MYDSFSCMPLAAAGAYSIQRVSQVVLLTISHNECSMSKCGPCCCVEVVRPPNVRPVGVVVAVAAVAEEIARCLIEEDFKIIWNVDAGDH